MAIVCLALHRKASLMTFKSALIVGAGSGLSASLARLFAKEGMAVALAARSADKLAEFAKATGAQHLSMRRRQARRRRQALCRSRCRQPTPDVVVYNPSYRTRGPFVELDPAEVEKTLAITAFGGFLVAQAAAKRMLPKGHGAILFTGASASVKGYAQSAPFAMGKFALRGLAQSMARELQPQGIHVAHFVIDGGIKSERRPVPADKPDSMLDPDAIAATYLQVLQQPRSAWTPGSRIAPLGRKVLTPDEETSGYFSGR